MNFLTDIQYFPPVIFYKNSFHFSNIVFERYEHYQKMSFMNRMMIAGANGIISLSIPLEHGRDQKRLMRDTRISNREKWQAQHFKSILSCYNHSPWFEYYRHELTALYEKSFDFLLDWDLACFEWVIKKLDWQVDISLTEAFQKIYDPVQWIDQRNRLLPKNYQQFEAVKYRQVFEERIGFLPNLSVLDLLCCEGKNAGTLLSGE